MDSAAFKRGDRVNEVLTGAGFTTTEESVVLDVRGGIAYVDQGPGNDPTRYDVSTGQYDGDGLGFSRRIEHVSRPRRIDEANPCACPDGGFDRDCPRHGDVRF